MTDAQSGAGADLGLSFDASVVGLRLDEVSVVIVGDHKVVIPLAPAMAESVGFSVVPVEDHELLAIGVLPSNSAEFAETAPEPPLFDSPAVVDVAPAGVAGFDASPSEPPRFEQPLFDSPSIEPPLIEPPLIEPPLFDSVPAEPPLFGQPADAPFLGALPEVVAPKGLRVDEPVVAPEGFGAGVLGATLLGSPATQTITPSGSGSLTPATSIEAPLFEPTLQGETSASPIVIEGIAPLDESPLAEILRRQSGSASSLTPTDLGEPPTRSSALDEGFAVTSNAGSNLVGPSGPELGSTVDVASADVVLAPTDDLTELRLEADDDSNRARPFAPALAWRTDANAGDEPKWPDVDRRVNGTGADALTSSPLRRSSDEPLTGQVREQGPLRGLSSGHVDAVGRLGDDAGGFMSDPADPGDPELNPLAGAAWNDTDGRSSALAGASTDLVPSRPAAELPLVVAIGPVSEEPASSTIAGTIVGAAAAGTTVPSVNGETDAATFAARPALDGGESDEATQQSETTAGLFGSSDLPLLWSPERRDREPSDIDSGSQDLSPDANTAVRPFETGPTEPPSSQREPVAAGPAGNAVIAARSVRRSVGTFELVIDELAVDAGQILVVQGAEREGKTTLARLIAGWDLPSAGSLYVAGIDHSELPEEDRAVRAGASLVMASASPTVVAELSVVENVELALLVQDEDPAAARRAALAELAELGIGHLADRPGASLARSEAVRVGLARTLVGEPAVVVADDVTIGLDDASVADVLYRLLVIAHAGAAVVVTTTDPRVWHALVTERGARGASLAGGRLQLLPA